MVLVVAVEPDGARAWLVPVALEVGTGVIILPKGGLVAVVDWGPEERCL